jgi:hypothetical protein
MIRRQVNLNSFLFFIFFLLRKVRLTSWDFLFVFYFVIHSPAAPKETVGEAGIELGTAARSLVSASGLPHGNVVAQRGCG